MDGSDICEEYDQGDLIRFTVTFTDEVTGDLVDPSVVMFSWRVGTFDTSEVITYTSATVPIVNVIARMSEGVYETLGDSSAVWGQGKGKWKSTGTGQATKFNYIKVNRNDF